MAHRTFVALEDAFKAIKEIQERIKYYDTDLWDFHQRRITNAHPSINDYDYVVRKELRDFTKETTVNIEAGRGQNIQVIGDRYLRTFGYGIGRDLTTGVDLLPDLIIPFASTRLEKIYFKAKIAPTGQDAIGDINKLGVSILDVNKLTVPDGNNGVQTITSFTTANFSDGEVLTFDMNQVGSVIAGQTLVMTMRFKILAI